MPAHSAPPAPSHRRYTIAGRIYRPAADHDLVIAHGFIHPSTGKWYSVALVRAPDGELRLTTAWGPSGAKRGQARWATFSDPGLASTAVFNATKKRQDHGYTHIFSWSSPGGIDYAEAWNGLQSSRPISFSGFMHQIGVPTSAVSASEEAWLAEGDDEPVSPSPSDLAEVAAAEPTEPLAPGEPDFSDWKNALGLS